MYKTFREKLITLYRRAEKNGVKGEIKLNETDWQMKVSTGPRVNLLMQHNDGVWVPTELQAKRDRVIHKFSWEIILKNKDNLPSPAPRLMIKCSCGISAKPRGPRREQNQPGMCVGTLCTSRGVLQITGKRDDSRNIARKSALPKRKHLSYTKRNCVK